MLKTHSWRTASLMMALTAIVGLALPALGGEGRPFRGHYDEIVTDATSVPDGLLVETSGSGQATHLGRFTREGRVVVDLVDGSAVGTAVFTAANGDQLFMEIEGKPTNSPTIGGTFMFTRGTGRFSDASGGVDFVGVIAPDGIHITVAFEGTIQY